MHSGSQGMTEARSLFKPIYTLIKGGKKRNERSMKRLKLVT